MTNQGLSHLSIEARMSLLKSIDYFYQSNVTVYIDDCIEDGEEDEE